MGIPLLNTIVLLSSGVTVTWAHHIILKSSYYLTNLSLIFTIFLGIYFSSLQGFEYIESLFTISDSVYGSSFFMATGFHGLHVIIGTSFLGVILFRLIRAQISKHHLTGFEAAA